MEYLAQRLPSLYGIAVSSTDIQISKSRNSVIEAQLITTAVIGITRFNNIATQTTAQMAADKDSVGLSRDNMHESQCSYEISVYSVHEHISTSYENEHNQLTMYSTRVQSSRRINTFQHSTYSAIFTKVKSCPVDQYSQPTALHRLCRQWNDNMST